MAYEIPTARYASECRVCGHIIPLGAQLGFTTFTSADGTEKFRPAHLACAPDRTPVGTSIANDAAEAIFYGMTARAAQLKYPGFTAETPAGPIRLSVNTDRSKHPGAISVTDGGPFGRNQFYGTIDEDGFTATRACTDAVAAALTDLAEDLVDAAARAARSDYADRLAITARQEAAQEERERPFSSSREIVAGSHHEISSRDFVKIFGSCSLRSQLHKFLFWGDMKMSAAERRKIVEQIKRHEREHRRYSISFQPVDVALNQAIWDELDEKSANEAYSRFWKEFGNDTI